MEPQNKILHQNIAVNLYMVTVSFSVELSSLFLWRLNYYPREKLNKVKLQNQIVMNSDHLEQFMRVLGNALSE